jgi:hypothetical protein
LHVRRVPHLGEKNVSLPTRASASPTANRDSAVPDGGTVLMIRSVGALTSAGPELHSAEQSTAGELHVPAVRTRDFYRDSRQRDCSASLKRKVSDNLQFGCKKFDGFDSDGYFCIAAKADRDRIGSLGLYMIHRYLNTGRRGSCGT